MAAGASVAFTVSFAPITDGVVTDILRVESDVEAGVWNALLVKLASALTALAKIVIGLLITDTAETGGEPQAAPVGGASGDGSGGGAPSAPTSPSVPENGGLGDAPASPADEKDENDLDPVGATKENGGLAGKSL